VLRRALDIQINGRRGRLRKTWRRQVEEENTEICLSQDVALKWLKCKEGLKLIASHWVDLATSVSGIIPDSSVDCHQGL